MAAYACAKDLDACELTAKAEVGSGEALAARHFTHPVRSVA